MLISWVGVDVGFKTYTNISPRFKLDASELMVSRNRDPNIWARELYPSTYAPTDENYTLYKPSLLGSASIFGELYYPALQRHPFIRDKVLIRRDVTITIDCY